MSRRYGGTYVKLGEKVPEYEVRIFPYLMKKKYGGQTLIKIENSKPFSSFGEIELPGINWVTVGLSLLMMDRRIPGRISKEKWISPWMSSSEKNKEFWLISLPVGFSDSLK